MDENPEFYYVVSWSKRDGWAVVSESRYDEEPIWDATGWRPVRDDEAVEDNLRYAELGKALGQMEA